MSRMSRRVLLVAIAAALLLVPVAAIGAGGFTDVEADSVFRTDIDWLASAGVTKGCNPPTNDRFCPGSNVTREQMAAFMHRLADYQVVDAGAVGGYAADELMAAGAGDLYWSANSPQALRDEVWTELGALQITVPAGGGVLSLGSLVGLTVPLGATGAYVLLEQTIDSSCSTRNYIASIVNADAVSVAFESVTLASAGGITEGTHTIRTCAQAYQINSLETINVTESQMSAVWTPAQMGGTDFVVASGDSSQESSLEADIKQRVAAAQAETGAGSGG